LAREKVKVFDDVCGEKEKREGVICTYSVYWHLKRKTQRPASFLTSNQREIEKDWDMVKEFVEQLSSWWHILLAVHCFTILLKKLS